MEDRLHVCGILQNIAHDVTANRSDAPAINGCNVSTWQDYCSTCAWRPRSPEQPDWQTARSVKQNVIEYRVLVINPGSATDHCFAVAANVPGESNLRPKVVIRLIDPTAIISAELI